MITIILITIIIIATLAIIYINTYNKLQYYKIRIEISENTIDENLRKKYDLICELNTEIKAITKEKDYLKEFIELKNKKLTNYESDRKLIEAIILIKELKNDYNELNSKEFNFIFNKIKKIDQELIAAKNFYNKFTAELNIIIRKFPTNLIARNHKFKIKPYFDNKNMQDNIIDDFKL